MPLFQRAMWLSLRRVVGSLQARTGGLLCRLVRPSICCWLPSSIPTSIAWFLRFVVVHILWQLPPITTIHCPEHCC